MKKVFAAAVGLCIAFGSITFATSCNKVSDWNCKCTVNGNTSTTVIKNKSRKEAKAQCNKNGNVLGVQYDCKLELF